MSSTINQDSILSGKVSTQEVLLSGKVSTQEMLLSGKVATLETLIGPAGPAGYTPVKGTDYFTEEDKTEMVNAVLAALPAAEGVSY